ncbi:hypothetical protein [uncultured Cedecea sp.]|uniref:hypothetical protein n=1 Tax=uncultured Cedecea sp. TaxID=988762 RepID=UPI00263A0865|nr:hypothetical protein [uncultured Cedecea sp.]
MTVKFDGLTMNQLAERNAELVTENQELQRKVEALTAENCIQDYIISAVKELIGESSGVAGWHLNGAIASWDEALPEINHSETPATDAALAEARAQGVINFVPSDEFLTELIRASNRGDSPEEYRSAMREVFASQLRKEAGL